MGNELEVLEREKPYIFWSGRVGKLEHLTLGESQNMEQKYQRTMKIKATVAGQGIAKKKVVKLYKMEGYGEVYKEIKSQMKQRKNENIQAVERIEKDIINMLKLTLECHWELAGEKLVKEGKWSEEDRRKARKAYWEQRTWKRRRRKKSN